MGANAANAGVTPGGPMQFDAQAAARAGTGGGLSLFHPSYPSGSAISGGGGFGSGGNKSFADIKAGFAEDRMGQQKALADAIANDGSNAYKPPPAAVNQEGYKAGPVEYQYYGDSMFGLLPKDYREPTSDPVTTWTDREWDFGGVDKGWENYEAEWQKSQDLSQYTPFSSEWMQAANMQTLRQNTGQDFLHSIQRTDPKTGQITMDARDPYGFGSDFGRYYDLAHGKGALQREANRYAKGFAENDPAFAGYEKGYGQIDWNDAAQVEDWFRRANLGGKRTASMQDTIAQNKRTDMTEGAIMAAMMAGMGALAAPATAAGMAGAAEEAAALGAGNLYSGAAGSGMFSSFTPTYDSLIRQGISGMGQQ